MSTTIVSLKKNQKNKRIGFIAAGLLLVISFFIFMYVPFFKLRLVALGEILPARDYINLQAIDATRKEELPTFYFTVVETLDIETLNDYARGRLYFRQPEIKPINPSGSGVQPEFNLTLSDVQKSIHYSTMASAQNLMLFALKQSDRPIAHTIRPTISVVYDAFSTGKVFREGDRILSIDDVPIESTKHFLEFIRGKQVSLGMTLHFKVQREQELLDIPIVYQETTNSGKPIIGIEVRDSIEFEGIDPMELLRFNGEIEGSSAGLMIALQLTQELLGTDLTRGYKIAGSGTLELDGSIGDVGSMVHKVKTAALEQVDIFFVPKSDSPEEKNEEEALSTAQSLNASMKIVPVSTFVEALDFLNGLTVKSGSE